MNKSDLIEKVSKQTGLAKSKTNDVINSVMESIQQSLSKGKKVTLVGFGTFDVAKRKARKGRNPKTGQVINIAAKKVARFRAGSTLAETVNVK